MSYWDVDLDASLPRGFSSSEPAKQQIPIVWTVAKICPKIEVPAVEYCCIRYLPAGSGKSFRLFARTALKRIIQNCMCRSAVARFGCGGTSSSMYRKDPLGSSIFLVNPTWSEFMYWRALDGTLFPASRTGPTCRAPAVNNELPTAILAGGWGNGAKRELATLSIYPSRRRWSDLGQRLLDGLHDGRRG